MPGMTTTQRESQQLFAGDFPRRFITVTIATDQRLAAGAVLGKVTARDEYNLSAATATDGSENPSVVLAEPVDTTAGPAPAEAIVSGDLKGTELTLGAGHTLEAVREVLRKVSIFIQ